VVESLAEESEAAAIVIAPRPGPPVSLERLVDPLRAETRIRTRSRSSRTSRTIPGLTVAAATVSAKPPRSSLPPGL
jgi:hypothetical protein